MNNYRKKSEKRGFILIFLDRRDFSTFIGKGERLIIEAKHKKDMMIS